MKRIWEAKDGKQFNKWGECRKHDKLLTLLVYTESKEYTAENTKSEGLMEDYDLLIQAWLNSGNENTTKLAWSLSNYAVEQLKKNVMVDDIFEGISEIHRDEPTSRVKSFTLEIDFVWDKKFFAILPAVNINRHSRELEFEWLCLGIYISKK